MPAPKRIEGMGSGINILLALLKMENNKEEIDMAISMILLFIIILLGRA